MAATLADLLEREHAHLVRQDGRGFYLQIGPYLDFLTKHRRLPKLISQLEDETRERLSSFVAEQNAFIEEAKRIRFELARRAPEIDNSGMVRPDPATHEYARWDLTSFARFDELTAAEIGIGYPTVPKDSDDPGPVSQLLIILRGRLNAAQYGEDGSPMRGPNRRSDLDDVWRPINNLQERHNHALRQYRQESQTLPGLAYARLSCFACNLNPPPMMVETEADMLRLFEKTLLSWGSPKQLVQKLVNGERLQDWEERHLDETTSWLKSDGDRLHQEFLRRLALAPWYQKTLGFTRREPLIVTIVGGVIAGLVVVLIVALL